MKMNLEEATIKALEGKLEDNENIGESFSGYKAFLNNFEPIIIKKSPYDKRYYIYKKDSKDDSDYIYNTDSKDNIEGWLQGMIMANNHRVKNIR